MASEPQRLIDHLGNRLRRSVAVADPRIRLLAYNAHTAGADVDDARVDSIMCRSVSSAVMRYLTELDIQHAGDVFTVPARPELGLSVDREDLADTESRGRERELLRELLSDDVGRRTAAAGRFVEEELLVEGPVTALVVTSAPPVAERDRHRAAVQVDGQARRAHDGGQLAGCDEVDVRQRKSPARYHRWMSKPTVVSFDDRRGAGSQARGGTASRRNNGSVKSPRSRYTSSTSR